MSEELLINVTPQETRVAFVENGVLQEVHIERSSKRGLVGNIYRGKVVRVLPGMQAAFVDIGLERTAFLHANDIISGFSDEKADNSQIQQLVREGQQVVVQVVKDPLGTKGARLTTQLSMPSRFLVYLPGSTHLGISQRIDNDDERERLRNVISTNSEHLTGGFIVRTAAEGISDEILSKDIEFLGRLWGEIEIRTSSGSEGGETQLIHEDMQVVMRTMRDIASVDIEKIRVDSRETFNKVSSFTTKLIPEIADRIVHYTGERPLFDLYGVEDEIQKALERKVQLKSGGYLILIKLKR